MANEIKLKRGSGSDPSASDLVVGEIAIRTDTGKLFTKKDDNSVAEISGGGIDDGDKGDITVSNSGATFTIDNDVVTNSKLENMSTQRIMGRTASGSGNPQHLTAAEARGILNVEDGATADQSASDIKTLLNSSGLANAQIDASAAIAGTKISPDFGSQNIVTTGTLGSGAITTSGNLNISNSDPTIVFSDSDNNPDFDIKAGGGRFSIRDATNNVERLKVNTDGHVDIAGNLDVGAGVDVTGNISVSGTVDGRDVATDGSKLDGIASGATNVTNNNQLTNGAGYITATLTNEQVQDIVGGMVSGNTESGITVTYQDGDGTLDFSVASQTDQNFTTTLKNKLDGIAAGATNVTNNNQISNGAGYLTSVGTSNISDAAVTNAKIASGAVGGTSLGSNAVSTAKIADGAVTNAKIDSMAASKLTGALPAIDGSNLTGISAGATGGGSDEVFYENDQTVTTNYTITNGKNAMAAGPITINSGVTVTVGSGETLTIV